MFIYFSSEKNMHIFDEEAKELGIDVQVEQSRSLVDYLDKNLNSLLNYLEFLAIDVDYIVDNDKEIIEKLSSLRTFKSSVTIIIVAFERTKGDILLGRFFASGIYNFVTSKDNMLNEIKICLDHNQNNSRNYANAIGFQVDFLAEEKNPDKKGFWGNVLGNLKNKDKKDKVLEKEPKRKSKFKDKAKSKKEKFEENQGFQNKSNSILEDFEDNRFDSSINNNNINNNIPLSKRIEESKNNNIQENNTNINEKLNNLFNKDNKNRFSKEKRRKRLEIEKFTEEMELFYYYQKPVGIIFEKTCLIDKIFEKDDIKKFFQNKEIDLEFKDNILKEINDIIKGL
ncbi:hypothetical protein [uncultured Tyzzerella sp.]|uniref:hypothetical protein n=1 Tax=uncultured Tyzzerella sp. TaxID=2321398 RepID=UPI002942F501|nr:hypothetical protein [uncultured Tyzzerella sp.]